VTFEIDAEIDRRHPALPGHFPGNPIVPAVVILAEVSAAIKAAFGSEAEITSLPTIKLLAPLLPGERCRIVLQPLEVSKRYGLQLLRHSEDNKHIFSPLRSLSDTIAAQRTR
jgi:3-hydroxymyristoyl/3-hydroxydecanoyl-(acyl carrier protein) dehydratase